MSITQIRLSEQALALSLTTGIIAELAVTSSKIGPGAVSTDKLKDFRPSQGTGALQLAVAAGKIRIDNAVSSYAGTLVLALTDDDTNYIESSSAGVVTKNLVGYTTGAYPIATVVTTSGVITSIVDDRGIAVVDPAAGADVDDFVTGTQVIREDAAGDGLALDGSDLTFTLANTPIAGSEEVYLNGILQQSGGADYAISGATVTMVNAPVSTDRVLVSYRYAA